MDKERNDIQAAFGHMELLVKRFRDTRSNVYTRVNYGIFLRQLRDIESDMLLVDSVDITSASLGDHC